MQRRPDALRPFIDQWMREHLIVDNAAFKALAQLPDEKRDGVLAEIRRRYGNEFIRRGQAGTLPDKDPEDKRAEPLNAEDYWKKYGRQTLDAAFERATTTVEFAITGPGLSFLESERTAFLHHALVGRMQRAAPQEVSQLLDTPLYELIDSVRVLDDLDKGADAYEPGVEQRIIERLGLGIRRAIGKLAVPYARARAKAIADARASNPLARPQFGPLASPDGDAATLAQPSPRALGARTTIEHAIAEALTSGLFVEFDEAKFGALDAPATTADDPRVVELDLERGRGDWKIARVVKPTSVTAADVANTLFGTPELANLVVGSGDRYAFTFPPGGVLAEPYDSIWHERMTDDEQATNLDLIRGRAPHDPMFGLDDESAELRAMDSAKGLPEDGDQSAVVQRLEIIQSHLTTIATAAAPIGVAGFVDPILVRITERMTAAANSPAVAQQWSAHSAAQIELLSDVKTGFDAITQQLVAMGIPAVSTTAGDALAGDVTDQLQGPTIELANAYAGVVISSDQLDIAKDRLAIAKERFAAYPFDMADRMLAVIRRRIASTNQVATLELQSYSRARMDALQQELSAQVAELRLAVVNGDGTAAERLSAIKSQLAMLDLQSTLGSTISVINELSGTLFSSESWSPDTDRQKQIYLELRSAISPWRGLAEEYDALWKAGKERDPSVMASVRQRVEALRKSSHNVPDLVKEVASFQEDEAERQRLIAIGIMIAAALLAAVTGGMASGAIGGVAGAIVGAGMEALTFTAITGTLNQDQTFGGFMAELGVNFATFGGLRAISGASKLLAGGKALTAGQALAEMTVEGLWMVAADKAHQEIEERRGKGEKMSTQTAAQIFGHQMLLSFAARVIGRAGSALLGRQDGAIDRLQEVQLVYTKRNDAKALAQAVQQGDDSVGAALVKADTEALRAEARALERLREIASNPALAKARGIHLDDKQLAEVTEAAGKTAREVTEREINELMQQVDKVHGDQVIAQPQSTTRYWRGIARSARRSPRDSTPLVSRRRQSSPKTLTARLAPS